MGQYEPSSGKEFNTSKTKFAQWLKTFSAGQGKTVNPVTGKTELIKTKGAAGSGMGGDISNEMSSYLQQMAYEYANYGGITPETRQRVMGLTGGGFVQDKKGNKQAAKLQIANNLVMQLKQYAGSLPVYTPGASGELPNISLMMKPEGMSQEDFMKYYLTNKALSSLDPQTKKETAAWLAQANPQLFAGYSGASSAPDAAPAQELDPEARSALLKQMAGTLDWNKVQGELPQGAQGIGSVADQNTSRAMMGWLNQYLNTAASGMTGTREQQLAAAGQLNRLMTEATNKGGAMAQIATLGENLVNPITKKAGLTGVIGSSRALGLPSGEYRRAGVAYRNPTAV